MAASKLSQLTAHCNPIDAALLYASFGWYVIPIHGISPFGGCTCSKGDACKYMAKHPRVLNWRGEASIDPGCIRTWWRRWPASNVGVLMGERSGIIDIEWDAKNNGEASWLAFQQEHNLSESTSFRSGGGGIHRLYAITGPVPTRKGFLQGLDILADGSYAVMPPSLHKSGNRYEVIA